MVFGVWVLAVWGKIFSPDRVVDQKVTVLAGSLHVANEVLGDFVKSPVSEKHLITRVSTLTSETIPRNTDSRHDQRLPGQNLMKCQARSEV